MDPCWFCADPSSYKLKWREVIRSCSLRDPYLATFDDPLTDGCQGTKDFVA